MSISSLKNELADHMYQYLCHEAQYSDLPEAARESLTAASECIEQAYKLNNNNTNNNNGKQQVDSNNGSHTSSILPDELLRIFTRHKEFISQQKDSNTTSKQHSQHTISQLPMTTRKKLSHLRSQIKRQASKAARSRLEKRSSVSGIASTSGGSFGGTSSFDANIGTTAKQTGDIHTPQDFGNQASSSSTDSPTTYLHNQSTSSPTGAGVSSSNQLDLNLNSSSSSGQQIESGANSSVTTKLGGHQIPGSYQHSSSIGVSVHQKNFKQKLIALIKKFRTDGSDFGSEEQYREALERELMKAAAGRGSRAIEELLEEEIDVEGESSSEPEDWDNVSETSTPKPSLRPFFSSTTLDKI